MIEKHLLKKNTVFNKIVPDFMGTLYIMLYIRIVLYYIYYVIIIVL